MKSDGTDPVGQERNPDLYFFASELLANHSSTFQRAVLIAARGKLRCVSGHNHADIENAFHDACTLALSGKCETFSLEFCSLIEPLREMAESITAKAGPQAAFKALETVLGPGRNVPETLKKAKAQARRWIGYIAGAMFNIVRNFLRDERRHNEIIAAASGGSVVVLGPGSGVQEERSEGNSDVADDSQNPLDWAIRNEQIAEVRSALTKLKPKNAELLRLRYYGDLSYQEIAMVMGFQPETIGTRLARAKDEFLAQYRRLKQLDTVGAAMRLRPIKTKVAR